MSRGEDSHVAQSSISSLSLWDGYNTHFVHTHIYCEITASILLSILLKMKKDVGIIPCQKVVIQESPAR